MLLKKDFGSDNPARGQIIVHPAYCHRFASLQKLRGSPELREHPILNEFGFRLRGGLPWPPRHRLKRPAETVRRVAALAPKPERISRGSMPSTTGAGRISWSCRPRNSATTRTS